MAMRTNKFRMKAYTRRRLLASAKLGLASVPFVVAIRAIEGGFLPGAVVLGFSLGFTVGVAELFLLKNWLKRLSFSVHIVVKSLLLMCFMGVAYALLNILDVLIDGISWYQYAEKFLQLDTLIGLIEMLGLVAFLLFFVQLDRLLGPGLLLGYMTGRYYQPRREDRIFMFLDLKGSTKLADSMNADSYFEFLHEYFREMSEPILETNAQIYQYVGDEVILTWTRKRGLSEENCIRVFFLISEHLQAQRDRFLQDFGTIPEFKAGVHAGEVITAEIGELKKEIVYNGDVLNTTARIQAKCNELGHTLLASAELVDSLTLGVDYSIHRLGLVALRGKAQAIELCAIRRSVQAIGKTQ